MQVKVWTLQDLHWLRVWAAMEPGANVLERLVDDLNELERYREAMRWRRIGEEWPDKNQECILANSGFSSEVVTFASEKAGWASSSYCGNCDSGGTDRCYSPDGKERYAEYDYPAYTHWRPVPVDVPKEGGNAG